jgi:protein disulfide-isomerase
MKAVPARLWLSLALLVLVGTQSACIDRESKAQTTRSYDESEDAAKAIGIALAELPENKRLLLIFGANWCPDCRRVDASMTQREIAEHLKRRFAIVKVDVGHFDKNTGIDERYGSPTQQGIPSFAMLDKRGEVTSVVLGRKLGSEHKKGRDSFYQWLKTL